MTRPPRGSVLTSVLDSAMDRLVVPGYSRLGPMVRRRWWPADPEPFDGTPHIVVTGGSSGLGRATAAGLSALGAVVHLVGRSAERLESSAATIRQAVPGSELELHVCDIGDLDAVAELAGELPETVHGLVHSAGLVPPERALSPQGHELAYATHVLGPFALTVALRQRLSGGRVIWVSSGGMYSAGLGFDLESSSGKYSGVRAYARTKRMQVVIAQQLAERFGRDPVVHSMHPGWASTPGLSDSLPGFDRITRPILRTAEQGADTIVWLAAAEEAGRSTGLFWCDRRPRPTHYLPWQRDDPAAVEHLWSSVGAATGLDLR
ncbi:SDR family NAD(P)-dependent oxidoreductase [Nakamurella sp. YIM 132087]|uniref:SDR family NAD(P)-dependent oxidoreductase n=1 Tax=Nakamurella alba TaxID=2665158 RepID=A0A7K1FM47_9ACTN|nr:SDR family NAD(P)-dependent oxidoreductase [Nakamurella alba]MTD15227.1 SDR family NAD(P)-dependent oxidoreductase [Nakamurella alba]